MNATQDPIESLLPMLGGLLVVLFFIFLLAFLVKRFNKFGNKNSLINVIETCAIGHKEKLSIVNVGKDYFLVGITGQSIQQIGRLDSTAFISNELDLDENIRSSKKEGFSSIITKLMSGEMVQEITNKKIDASSETVETK